MTFEDTIRAHGLIPKGPVVDDGRWHRCGTQDKPRSDNGAYKLMPGGRRGFYWNLALDDGVIRWFADGRSEAGAAPVDEEDIRRQAERRRQRIRRSTEEAREFYRTRCVPLRGAHPYLESHMLDMRGCSGLKRATGGWPAWDPDTRRRYEEEAPDADGWLIVPAFRDGKLVGIQRIAANGEKKFWPGTTMTAARYVIDRRDAIYTVLCEGLATGLAIHAAVPMARIVVCFTAGNLVKVAEEYEPQGWVAVAADNDHATERRLGKNPGLEAGRRAAEILGCGVFYPEGIEGTDWADWRMEQFAQRKALNACGRFTTDRMLLKQVDGQLAHRLAGKAVYVRGRKVAAGAR